MFVLVAFVLIRFSAHNNKNKMHPKRVHFYFSIENFIKQARRFTLLEDYIMVAIGEG